MIIVLEGLNGVGKSARARQLSELTGVPVVRPFRRSPDQHLGREDGGLLKRLRALGIPANTYVEDMFMADMLVQTGASAILDRSMISGVAYGALYNTLPGATRAERSDVAMELVRLWQETLKRYSGVVLYVSLTATRTTCQERTVGRWSPDPAQERELSMWYDVGWQTLDLPKMHLDTTPGDLEGDLERIRASAWTVWLANRLAPECAAEADANIIRWFRG